MSSKLVVILFVLCASLAAVSAHAQSLIITGPKNSSLLEGSRYPVTWRTNGLRNVQIIAYGTRTPLGINSRGDFLINISPSLPANSGKFMWTVPWIDSRTFYIKINGYDSSGKLKTSAQRQYDFRPAALAHRMKDGIYLDLHKRTDQRLYVQKGGKITHVYISTSSRAYKWEPRNVHPTGAHDHAGVFRVISKSPDHFSMLFHVHMRWAMQYWGGHFIHATTPDLYPYLGEAASSGCNRLTLEDAYDLYNSTPIGTRVEIIGPSG